MHFWRPHFSWTKRALKSVINKFSSRCNHWHSQHSSRLRLWQKDEQSNRKYLKFSIIAAIKSSKITRFITISHKTLRKALSTSLKFSIRQQTKVQRLIRSRKVISNYFHIQPFTVFAWFDYVENWVRASGCFSVGWGPIPTDKWLWLDMWVPANWIT